MASPNFEITTNDEDRSVTITNGGKKCLVYELMYINDRLMNAMFGSSEKEDGTIIYISSISKCSDAAPLTRDVIKLVEQSASSDPHIKFIQLDDESSIHVCTVPIDLAYLKILTTGESWYNSIGFKSLTHDFELAHNAKIINIPIHLLLSQLTITSEHLFPGFLPTLDNLLSLFPHLSPELSVKDFISSISIDLPRSGTSDCTELNISKAMILYNLIYTIRKNAILIYNTSLHKKVLHTAPSAARAASRYGRGGGSIKHYSTIRNKRLNRFHSRKKLSRNST